MMLDSLMPWRAPLAALAVALAWTLLLRRRPGLAGLGLGIGLLAGFWLLLGFGLASPRQLFERLPGLALGALILGVPLAMTAARPVHVLALAAAALGVGWWMAGGPLPLEDMRRAAPVWMAVSLATTLLLLENGGRWQGLVAAALLAALLALAAAPGPWMLLGLCVLAATAGASAALPALPPAARLALAAVMAALMCGPVLARGAASDWLAALGPLALLLVATKQAAKSKPWRATATWAAIAIPLLLLGWVLQPPG
jgi:hypothetical protein